jgi:O-antigen/teichoic acid export membrane protein
MLLPQSIGAALSPRMSERFGRTADERSIGHYSTDVQSLLAQLILPLMVGAAFFLMPVLIREGLPQFTPAIPVVRIMVAGSFFIALSTMPIKVLLAAGYRWSVTGLTLLALAVNAIANVVAVGVLSGGLTGAAYAVVFSYFFTFVVLTSFALTRTSTRREATAHMGTIVIMFAYTVGALWAIEGLLGSGAGGFASDVLTGVAKLAILVVLLTPWIALAQRRLGAFTALSSLARGAIHKAASRRSK